jgi:hypothetical protein
MSKKENKVTIKSKNQSGGITAQNVNTGNGEMQFNINSEETKKKGKGGISKSLKIIIGIVSFIAALVTILTYLDILPFGNK